jgi:hypothetical protein
MATQINRAALLATLAGAALAGALTTAPAKALTLVDNTSLGTKTPTGTAGSFVGNTPNQNRVALSFTTNANWRPYTQFSFKVPLTDSGTSSDTLTNLNLQIFAATGSGDPTGSALFATSYASQVGRYGTFLAPFADGTYNSFFIDTVTPILAPSSSYAFVFSSNNIFLTSSVWTVNGVSPSGATDQTFATLLASRRSTTSGTSWLTSASAGGFFLDGVPGPLPVLGAGSAFAWSRRLRRRVSQARLSSAQLPKAIS